MKRPIESKQRRSPISTLEVDWLTGRHEGRTQVSCSLAPLCIGIEKPTGRSRRRKKKVLVLVLVVLVVVGGGGGGGSGGDVEKDAPKATAPFVFSPPTRIGKPAEAACWGEKPAPRTPNYTGPGSPDPLPFQVTALAWPERSLGPTLVHT
ncbi:hypothetical protein M0802_000900 [Mischocyttarus mexicanus]|nr:hypothetical protein M0802_000900 [Mischocyttarus mexicanus]